MDDREELENPSKRSKKEEEGRKEETLRPFELDLLEESASEGNCRKLIYKVPTYPPEAFYKMFSKKNFQIVYQNWIMEKFSLASNTDEEKKVILEKMREQTNRLAFISEGPKLLQEWLFNEVKQFGGIEVMKLENGLVSINSIDPVKPGYLTNLVESAFLEVNLKNIQGGSYLTCSPCTLALFPNAFTITTSKLTPPEVEEKIADLLKQKNVSDAYQLHVGTNQVIISKTQSATKKSDHGLLLSLVELNQSLTEKKSETAEHETIKPKR